MCNGRREDDQALLASAISRRSRSAGVVSRWGAALRSDRGRRLRHRAGLLIAVAKWRDAVASASRASRIAQVRYDAGATGYLDAIDAQRSLLAMQRLETQIKGARATSTVALIRALGGGWEAPTAVSSVQ